VIERRNKRRLQREFAFRVSDHIGCVAVTPEYLIGGNWDSLVFYVWDHSGKLLRTVDNETHNAYQDMKFDGRYIVASGLLRTVAAQSTGSTFRRFSWFTA
jgi:hypothetical protein